MPLQSLLDFNTGEGVDAVGQDPVKDPAVANNQDLPKELDIFFRGESNFLPPGKTLEDLTPEELELLKNRYRFDPFRPGIYQGITGLKNT